MGQRGAGGAGYEYPAGGRRIERGPSSLVLRDGARGGGGRRWGFHRIRSMSCWGISPLHFGKETTGKGKVWQFCGSTLPFTRGAHGGSANPFHPPPRSKANEEAVEGEGGG